MTVDRFLIVDVFTERPLAGNQLAVFPDASRIPEARLQPLAREIGFSETVYAFPDARARDADELAVRIFTPDAELQFAGHPILGTAVALAHPERAALTIRTGRGAIPVRLDRRPGRATFGWMSQPIPTIEPLADDGRLLVALGVDRSALPIEVYDNGVKHAYVALDSPAAVSALEPDVRVLARWFPGVGINCFAGERTSWKTRMFYPSAGVAEDPATGSAAGPLALHLARHGRIAIGDRIEISQGTEIGRPSTLYAAVRGAPAAIEEVGVGGHAVLVGRGEFELPA
jgi:trans-2,3-dihydro-3-hydroxyanthranilate isomerase